MEIYDSSIEKCVIGALCIGREESMKKVIRFLKPEDFVLEPCGKLYDAMFQKYINHELIDVNLLPQVLVSSMSDPVNYIRECMMMAPTTNNVELHAHVVRDASKYRTLRDDIWKCFDELSGNDLATTIMQKCRTYLEDEIGHVKNLSDLMIQMMDDLSKPVGLRINTGYPRLDGIIHGMRAGELIIIGARPSVGKTCFSMELARSAAKQGHNALFVSLEMTKEEIAQRYLSNQSSVSLGKIIDNNMTDSELAEYVHAGAKLSELPIIIEDAVNVTVEKIRAEAIQRSDLDIIFVDYVGLLQSTQTHQNRNYELGAMSRNLKNLAMELKIPIVVMAQLNRNVSPTQEPHLSDLRDSGELEQNANKVIFLWTIDEDSGIRGVKVAKNRSGKTGTVQMNFDGEHQRFIERSEDVEYDLLPHRGGYSSNYDEH